MGKYKRKQKYLYLMVTKDEYEFPVAIADTPKELAAMTGFSANTIRSSITHGEQGVFNSKFKRVEIEGDLENE